MSWMYAGAAFATLAYFGVQKLQSFLIYPSNFPEDSRTEVDNPSSFGLEFEELWLETSDKVKLHAYYIPKPGAKVTVVMFGPNAGNIGHSLPIAQIFHREIKTNVLTVSYRGYGHSTGSPSERGLKIDALTVAKYIRDTPALNDTTVVLYGRSLGGAVTIYLASQAPELIKAVIVENTFLSIVKLIPSVLPPAKYVQFLVNQRWPSEKTILDMDPSCKALFLSGEKDELVPPTHFRKLFELCPCNDKQFKSFPNGYHNDTCIQQGYWRDVHFFIEQLTSV